MNKKVGPIRLFLVEDQDLMREGIAALFERVTDISLIAQAATGRQAIALIAAEHPDVSLIDLRLPDISGTEVISQARKLHPEGRYMVLTTFDGDEDIYRALEAGAAGYLLKTTRYADLVEAIRAVHRGETQVAPSLAQRALARMSAAKLTAQERRILAMVAKGQSNKQIATALFISEKTVKNHLTQVMAKLNARSRTEAAMTAVRQGFVRFP